MASRWGNNRKSERPFFFFLICRGSGEASKSLQIVTAAMKLRHLLLERKPMTNIDSILKTRDITLPKNVLLVKTVVVPVVMYDVRVGL